MNENSRDNAISNYEGDRISEKIAATTVSWSDEDERVHQKMWNRVFRGGPEGNTPLNEDGR